MAKMTKAQLEQEVKSLREKLYHQPTGERRDERKERIVLQSVLKELSLGFRGEPLVSVPPSPTLDDVIRMIASWKNGRAAEKAAADTQEVEELKFRVAALEGQVKSQKKDLVEASEELAAAHAKHDALKAYHDIIANEPKVCEYCADKYSGWHNA